VLSTASGLAAVGPGAAKPRLPSLNPRAAARSEVSVARTWGAAEAPTSPPPTEGAMTHARACCRRHPGWRPSVGPGAAKPRLPSLNPRAVARSEVSVAGKIQDNVLLAGGADSPRRQERIRLVQRSGERSARQGLV